MGEISQCKPWVPKAHRREGGGNDESLFEVDNNVYIKPRNTFQDVDISKTKRLFVKKGIQICYLYAHKLVQLSALLREALLAVSGG